MAAVSPLFATIQEVMKGLQSPFPVSNPTGSAPKERVLRYDRATVDQYNSTVTYSAMAFC